MEAEPDPSSSRIGMSEIVLPVVDPVESKLEMKEAMSIGGTPCFVGGGKRCDGMPVRRSYCYGMEPNFSTVWLDFLQLLA